MSQFTNLDELIAYADGEIDAQQVSEVEERLAQDSEAREFVRELREGSALLRAAFNAPLHEPLPSSLHEAIDREFAARRTQATPIKSQSGWLPMALAASLAAIVIGLSSAYFLADRQVELTLAQLDAMNRQDKRVLQVAINRSLEQNVSGTALDWNNPDTGSRGLVTPIRTFKSTVGQWCREYEAVVVVDQRERVRRAIACRTDDGRWDTRVELVRDS